MNNEFFEALAMLEKERGISAEELIAKITKAIESAVKKDYEVDEDRIKVEIDPESGKFAVSIIKDVVDEMPGVRRPDPEPVKEQAEDGDEMEEAPVHREPPVNLHNYILTPDAQEIRKTAKAGGQIAIPLKTKEFGRIAAQTAKHVIRQGLREAERSQLYNEMQSKAHEIVGAVVTRVDDKRGIVSLELGKGEAILPRNEQVPGEELYEGQHVKVYVVDVTVTDRGPKVMISRTHPGLVKRMFEMEVPEIFDGTVEIRAISREAGMRTKMAVWSKDENVDPVGACIGPHGQRVSSIVEELGGEKIDIVRYSDDPAEFISAALSPASVVKVELLEGDQKSCRVTVPDHQLSLAIGNKGQNARLTARLTGYNIDIRPESGYYGEEEPAAEK
ncbi:MAG: transcription termination factor NusA [Oscillospiraceae bacterium]|nr:transcription termination factor NusA [Oscillospiraceae bacterium]